MLASGFSFLVFYAFLMLRWFFLCILPVYLGAPYSFYGSFTLLIKKRGGEGVLTAKGWLDGAGDDEVGEAGAMCEGDCSYWGDLMCGS